MGRIRYVYVVFERVARISTHSVASSTLSEVLVQQLTCSMLEHRYDSSGVMGKDQLLGEVKIKISDVMKTESKKIAKLV